MNVGELKRKLEEFPDDMEVVLCATTGGYGADHDIYDVGEAFWMSRTIGIATDNPKTYNVVCIDKSMCGL